MGEEEKSGVESCPKFTKPLCPSSFRGEAPSSEQTLSNHTGQGRKPLSDSLLVPLGPKRTLLVSPSVGFHGPSQQQR